MYFNNYPSDINITSATVAGSYANLPDVLSSATWSPPSNNNINAIAQRDYSLESVVGAPPFDIVVVQYWIDSMQIELTKSAGSSSFTATGLIMIGPGA